MKFNDYMKEIDQSFWSYKSFNDSWIKIKWEWAFSTEWKQLLIEWTSELVFPKIQLLSNEIKLSISDIVKWRDNNYLLFINKLNINFQDFHNQLLIILTFWIDPKSNTLKQINILKNKIYLNKREKKELDLLKQKLVSENKQLRENFLN